MIETHQKLPDQREKEMGLQMLTAREIVSKIIQFGVTQVTILYIIKLLSLELENVKLMQALSALLKQHEQFVDDADISRVSQKTIYT